MLETLTKKQEQLMEDKKNEWLKLALESGDELDVEAFKRGVTFLYELSTLKDPIKVYVDSPLSMQYACQLLKNTGIEELAKSVQARIQVWDQVKNQVRDQVGIQVGDQVGNQVKNQVRDQVRDQVKNQVRDQVRDQVENQVRDQVGIQVWDQVWDQVKNQVWDQVGIQVWDQVGIQVGDQVGNQVRDQVGIQVGDYEQTSYNGLFWDAGWMSFYDYFTEIGIVRLELFDTYKEFIQSGVYDTIMFDKFVIGCRRPQQISRNTQFVMHSTTGPAISWRDGFSLHYLNGVYFSEELFKKVTSGTMLFEDILKIEDIDQRTQAMRFGDVKQFLAHTKAEQLDSYIKYRPNGTLINYALYKIKAGDIFRTDAYYMIYDCPSTGHIYMSGVEECKTVAEAMSWKMSDDDYKVTPEQWSEMIPLKDEA